MTPRIKRGSTFAALLEFEPDEWAGLYPWSSVAADAVQGAARYRLTVTEDAAARSILLEADTSDWLTQLTQIDVRLVRDGRVIFLPGAENMQVNVVSSVTGVR